MFFAPNQLSVANALPGGRSKAAGKRSVTPLWNVLRSESTRCRERAPRRTIQSGVALRLPPHSKAAKQHEKPVLMNTLKLIFEILADVAKLLQQVVINIPVTSALCFE
jgi:hypothetical protein